MAQELLTLQNLAKYYTSAQSVVVGLNQLNLTFRRGEFVAVTGESGSGKSTLAHVLGGILPYEGGELLYKGKPTSHYDSGDWERYRRDCVSFISQSYGILPGSTVQDNVTCALRLVGFSREQAERDAEAILKKVELWDLRRRRAAKLSSGQKQRLSIARALAKPAPVLIADEPTGNLDAENSAMVISLLAEAAKDRLVILITHEFSEAADYVTRHIELHDGRVTMDATLRELPELPSGTSKAAKAEGKKGLSWFVSRFQIKARPIWAMLMLGLFALAVFAMFSFTGTFISNLDDTFTYYYDNSAFRNGNDRRIVVARTDGEEFTPEDVEKLLSVRYVESMEEYGVVTDVQYAYREGIDYEIIDRLEGGDFSDYYTTQSYTLAKTQGSMPFIRTVPTLPDGQEFLTAGRLPENFYEVVAAGGEELLGQKITVLIQDQKNWNVGNFLRYEVTVVGVTNYGSHLYFHGDLGRMLLGNAKEWGVYIPLRKGSVLMGESYYTSFGARNKVFLYLRIDGTLAGPDEVSAEVCGQIQRGIAAWGEDVSAFLKELSEDPYWMQNKLYPYRLYILNNLRYYAFRLNVPDDALLAVMPSWETEDLSALMAEAGAAMEAGDPIPEEWVTLLREAKALGEKLLEAMKEFDDLDPDSLTTEEALALAERFHLSIREIRPGETLVSPGLMRNILAVRLEREGVPDSQADWNGDRNERKYLSFELDTPDGKEKRELTILGSQEMEVNTFIMLHPDDFDELAYPGKGEQVSVFVEDYAYVDRVLDSIHGLGYVALSPYQEGAVQQNEELAEQRMQTLRVCLIALLAVIVLQILLLRAMFSMETESYRLLSHIGLNCVTAQRSVLWQIMLFALGGQVLGIGLITACAAGGMGQVVNLLRYLPLSYRLVLCLIHLCASAFTAVWTMRALKKQVFPESGAEPDLDWDAIGEEVEA